MNLKFSEYATGYRSGSQIARVVTERWVSENMFCPRCGRPRIEKFENNRPVADFYCPDCRAEFELKSKNGTFGKKINDGAYDTMIQRITSNNNPDFIFMSYSRVDATVNDLLFVPKHFFTPDIIEKRPPLAPTARRAGWVGCNILLNQIPEQGRVSVVASRIVQSRDSVVEKVRIGDALHTRDIAARGWLLDVLSVVNLIPNEVFSLNEVYAFVNYLSEKHPQNNNMQAKIRQQLQLLRDKGFIEFLGNGHYRKTDGCI